MKGIGKFSFRTMLLVLFLAFVVYLIFHNTMRYEGIRMRGKGGSPRPQNPKWNSCQSQFTSCMSSIGGSYLSCQPQRESCLQ